MGVKQWVNLHKQIAIAACIEGRYEFYHISSVCFSKYMLEVENQNYLEASEYETNISNVK